MTHLFEKCRRKTLIPREECLLSLPHRLAVLYRLLELRPVLHSLRLTSYPGAVTYSLLHLRVVLHSLFFTPSEQR